MTRYWYLVVVGAILPVLLLALILVIARPCTGDYVINVKEGDLFKCKQPEPPPQPIHVTIQTVERSWTGKDSVGYPLDAAMACVKVFQQAKSSLSTCSVEKRDGSWEMF